MGEGADADFLILVLELVELPVEAAVGEQFLVRTHLAELPLVHDEDRVCALNGRQPMCDEDAGAALDHAFKSAADAQFGVGVDAGGSFVEDEDARIVGERAREVDELLLAGGKRIAAFAAPAHRTRPEATR